MIDAGHDDNKSISWTAFDLIIKCKCGKEIGEGYYCPERDIVLCNECQEEFDMHSCPHDNRGEHHHVKWPSISLNSPISKKK